MLLVGIGNEVIRGQCVKRAICRIIFGKSHPRGHSAENFLIAPAHAR